MTFLKPSTVLNETGAYQYKGPVLSSAQNYIDNTYANVLDKTGDSISGTINVLAGAEVNFESGSLLLLNGTVGSGITFSAVQSSVLISQGAPGSDFFTPGTLAIQSANAWTGAATHTSGGSLLIGTGNATPASAGTVGTLTLQLGNGISAGNVLVATPTNTSLYVDGTHLVALTSTTVEFFEPTVEWASTVVFPKITQIATAVNNATAQPMYVLAQNATGTSSTGGALVLGSGSGTAAYGQIYMAPGISAVAQFAQLQGTINTQAQINQTFMAVASTTASGSNIQLATIPVADLAAVFVEIVWIRRGLTGSGGNGNRLGFVGICNSGGTVTINTPTALYSGAAFDSASNLSITTSTNLITVTVVAQSSAADWEAVITVVNS